MTGRDRRLRNTYAAMKRLAEKCASITIGVERQPRFEFTHNGAPQDGEYPDVYGITLRVKGIESARDVERIEHKCTIYLPADFPTKPPIVKWHTPIFHPNIQAFDENNQLYQELSETLGSEKELTKQINHDPRFAELLDGYVCLDALKKNWTPMVGVESVVIELANMVRFHTYNVNSVLNKAAADWVNRKAQLTAYFPLDQGLLEVAETSILKTVTLT